MPAQKLIAVKEFCAHHNISTDLIREFQYNEIIELVMIKRTSFIAAKNLHAVELAVRLYNDLNINIEGIQTILHLRLSLLQKEVELTSLKNKLAFYSNEL